MKISEPNIAMPMRKPNRLEIAKIELRNSRIGRIGSEARSSTTTKATARTTPATSSPTPVLEPQPRSGPAQAV